MTGAHQGASPKQDPFAIVPWDVAADDRLTARELRVLIALLSFRTRATGLFFATRAQIAERCGLPQPRISTTTTSLEAKGYLRKHGRGGRGKAANYEFTMPPKTVTEVVTVTEVETVTGLGLNGYQVGNLNGYPRGVHTETHTETHTERKTNTARAGRSAASRAHTSAREAAAPSVCPDDVESQTWGDWLAVRKAKRAGPVTATVLAAMRREAARAGISTEAAVRTCAERGWQGFRADWMQQRPQAPQRQPDCDEYGPIYPAWRMAKFREVVATSPGIASPEARAAVAAEAARRRATVIDMEERRAIARPVG